MQLLVLFSIATLVSCHDITIGEREGRKIFDETRQANPAIWRQIENVTIIAPASDVISGVVITDMRPEKDGDVQIVDGGDGMKSVTIELKSPTVLRGYEFHLEVYTVPETKLTDAEEGKSETTVKSDITENSETTTHKAEGSGEEVKDSESDSDEKATETSESSTVQIPVLVGKTIVDGDILRQSRQTQTNPEAPSDVDDSSEKTAESDVTTTEKVDDITTEADTTTKKDEDLVTFAPETFDNNKNTPDYPALDILDLIKGKEATRRIRHTDDETNKQNEASTTESMSDTESSSTVSPLDISGNKDDDTIDLVPPVETEYNTGFSSDNEEVDKSTEDDKPRSGRGLDLSEKIDTTSEPNDETTTVEVTTSADNNSEHSTTESTVDEQARNTRDATNNDNVSNNVDNETPQVNPSLCPAQNDKPNNVIILNGEQLTLTPDPKLQFGIPIVLIIGSETNIPTIKIIAENSSENDKDLIVPEVSISENGETGYKSSDYPQDDLVPQPMTNYN